MISRIRTLFFGLAAVLYSGAAMAAPIDPLADPSFEKVAVWPGSPPGGLNATAKAKITERSQDVTVIRDRYIEQVERPDMVVFKPKTPNGTSLLMAPGGGYIRVVMDKEGYETAERFAAAGVTVYVMTYRLPGDNWAAGPDVVLQDMQRALRLVRQRATKDGLDPKKVGVIGFSAGGHAAGSLTFRFDEAVYKPVDAADQLSARPDFSVLMYPVATMADPFVHAGSRTQLLGKEPTSRLIEKYSLEKEVRPDAPPVIFIHAADDASVPVENSLQVFAALKAAKVPAEMHIYEEGGHGFGLRAVKDKPVEAWPDAVLNWMKRKGF
ncbi:alpha/beta hydrolase [Caulobacter segnis]|uniref:alpha/beta hydrolase n=1 Tax=Caulobacter segnis TaxID=88688 RepID=UPI0024109F08|nr:alpha/beta hydrolase [Caulobacter segnis]MDG2520971.1 alpha/beta hydrolase [Caulobacter segnis]